ncbi:MAG TPA: hypothetical protein VG650_17895 [Mycobacteriales bacterium]|nr:hypothetical protein [Mycobacteriales bacterium]
MKSLRHVLAAGVLLPLPLAGIAQAATSSSSAPTTAAAVRVLAADDRYLVYATYPKQSDGRADFALGVMYARTASGHTRRVGPFDASKWLGDTDGLFSLAGSMLTLEQYPAVKWWDLADGTTGVTDLPDRGSYLAATPKGWLLVLLNADNGVGGDSMVLRQETPGGTVATFATPFGTPSGHQIEGSSGPAGFLAVDDPAGTLEYLPWTTPQQAVSVKNPHLHSSDTSCIGVTTKVAYCTISYDKADNGFDAKYHEIVFLDGGHQAVTVGRLINSFHRNALSQHGAVTATGRGLAVIGSNGRVYTLSYDGRTARRATGTVPTSAQLIPGYHSVIVVRAHQLDELARPGGRVHRIATG